MSFVGPFRPFRLVFLFRVQSANIHNTVKRLAVFSSPAGMSLTKLSLAGNNYGKTINLFFTVYSDVLLLNLVFSELNFISSSQSK